MNNYQLQTAENLEFETLRLTRSFTVFTPSLPSSSA